MNPKQFAWAPLLLVALICVVIFGCIYTVDEGERAVVLRNGRLVEVAEPGLGFKWPLIESAKTISIRNHAIKFGGVDAYTHDQQPAKLVVSATYHVPATGVRSLYSLYGSLENMEDRLISRQLPTQVENVFGQYTAISVVKDRALFVKDLNDAVRAAIKDSPVIIDSVQVENIDFSAAYEKSIEDRMDAEVKIATRRQNLETEKVNAEITVTKAKAEADSRLAAAKAEAEAVRLKGLAEAESIRARGEALRQNPQVVNLTTAQRWDGKLPDTMIPGGTVPFVEVKPTSN
mgnify:CR=1 FL=1